ncbi:glycosyltransferase [Lysinibacillus fusiformis]|uniref:glycosyltransferase n=1 Tax=Lysinibacillus fusiformis TaxID=28031 RepID=UPI00148BFF9C|nr:glycosyltransferase [Lysinibacillus fusiformis]NOG29135.1 glycosyltransferase [Lysinibacillus fusiformis]
MKNVLFLTYYFPPYTDSGVFRPLKFVKYLKKNRNWNPIVVTLNPDIFPERPRDNSLLKDIPEDLEIHYVNTLEPTTQSNEEYLKYFYEVQTPEAPVGSLMHFLFKSLEIINSKKIDLIFVTIPPYTLGIVGTLLKQMTQIPLIVDYRDGWTRKNENNKFRTLEGRMINELFEKKVIENADSLVTVNNELKSMLSNMGADLENIHVIENGFDYDDYNCNQVETYDESVRTLVWCGKIYPAYYSYFEKIIEALKEINKDDIVLKFLIFGGGITEKFKLLFEIDFIEYSGYINYLEAIRINHAATINVLINNLEVGGTSKLYNLVAAKRPIFSLVNDENNFVKEFLKPYNNSIVVNYSSSIHEILGGFSKLLKDEKNNIKEEYINSYDKYSREFQAKQLENVFNSLNLVGDTL